MNNNVKELSPGSGQSSLDILLFFYTVRRRLGQVFKGVVLKACVEIVTLLEQWLEHHRL